MGGYVVGHWVAGRFCVNAPARLWAERYGERSCLIACVKMSALGQFDARYSRMHRVLLVTTAASLSSLMRSVSTWAQAKAVPCSASARSRSIST